MHFNFKSKFDDQRYKPVCKKTKAGVMGHGCFFKKHQFSHSYSHTWELPCTNSPRCAFSLPHRQLNSMC